MLSIDDIPTLIDVVIIDLTQTIFAFVGYFISWGSCKWWWLKQKKDFIMIDT
jgi:hypothetical protein